MLMETRRRSGGMMGGMSKEDGRGRRLPGVRHDRND